MDHREKVKDHLPSLFLQRLESIVGPNHYVSVRTSFSFERTCSLRVNTLQTTVQAAMEKLSVAKVNFIRTKWSDTGLELPNLSTQEISRSEWANNGDFYIQSFSSMLPPIVLDPLPNQRVLDLCAAPGSKTTQMAAMMGNRGEIVAVDSVRSRFYRLKSVLRSQGAEIVHPKCLDGSRYRSVDLFDKILVDAPCSSESRFKAADPETVGYWSVRKIKEMAHKQKGLLLNACRLLKPGGILVYSTCTFAPEENEAVVDWLLRKMPDQVKLLPIDLPEVERYPAVLSWEKHVFDPSVRDCFRVLPVKGMEGFFMAKLTRL